jgi:hypothetical protein
VEKEALAAWDEIKGEGSVGDWIMTFFKGLPSIFEGP